MAKNVLGTELQDCSHDPLTGYYRNGCCDTGPGDMGVHTVCAIMTEEFLAFSKEAGNDLSTPMPEYGFTGLKPGDQWCLCASRWQEAFLAGKAPKVRLESTHMATLEWASLQDLKEYEFPQQYAKVIVLTLHLITPARFNMCQELLYEERDIREI